MAEAGEKLKYYQWTKEDLERALLAYEKKEMSLNKIAATYSIPKPTILRHVKKRNKIAVDTEIQKGRPAVFNQVIEDELAQHILNLEKYMFGLTITDIRRLAFDIAEKHNIPNNFNTEKRMAGKGWFYKFMKRHPELSVRQPESTSLNRIKGFNKENVYNFFDLLEKIVDENGLSPTNIYNVDESGFSTVQKKPQKIVGLKGKKQVGAATSGERGVNTTAVCCASVSGQFIPPMLIFKRMRHNPELADGAPLGSIVHVSESGYINSSLFVEWLKHFIKTVKPSPDNKVLLLLDGHSTHSKNLEALCLAKTNGIIMLQLPGHTTNRIQPLDVSFFKPLSTYYIQSTEKWLRTNPGRQVTQYQVAKLFAEAYERAAVIGNIANGFRASGVWPINRHVFPEHMFAVADNLLNADLTDSTDESTSMLLDYTDFETQVDPENEENKKQEETCTRPSSSKTIDVEEQNDNEKKKLQEQEEIQVRPSTSKITDSEKQQDSSEQKEQQRQKYKNILISTSKTPDLEKKIYPEQKKINIQEEINEQASTLNNNCDASTIAKTIKHLSPLPKTKLKKKSTIQKAVEITSTPYKNQLEERATKQKKTKTKVKIENIDKTKKNSKANKKKAETINKKKGNLHGRNRTSSTSSVNTDTDSETDVEKKVIKEKKRKTKVKIEKGVTLKRNQKDTKNTKTDIDSETDVEEKVTKENKRKTKVKIEKGVTLKRKLKDSKNTKTDTDSETDVEEEVTKEKKRKTKVKIEKGVTLKRNQKDNKNTKTDTDSETDVEEKVTKEKKRKTKVKIEKERNQRESKNTKGKGKNYKKRLPSTSSDDLEDDDIIIELDDDDETDDDLDNICGKCNRNYYDKRGPKVEWLQCVRCRRWLHETCTSNPDICDSCLF